MRGALNLREIKMSINKTNVSLVKCESYERVLVEKAVRQAIDLIGGIQSFVKPGERILLKPNLLAAKEPGRAITTHPEVLRAVIRILKEVGVVPLIGDSPGGVIKGVERYWEITGMKKVAFEEDIELVNFEKSSAVEKSINHRLLSSIYLAKITQDVDGIINLPKLKTHVFSIYTGAIKNFYGCIPGLRKAEYHKPMPPYTYDFANLLIELYMLMKDKVRLNLMDGIIGMEGNGPSSKGIVRKFEIVAASCDAVALDTMLISMFGMNPLKIKTIKSAANAKAGESNKNNIKILGDNPSVFNMRHVRFPTTWYFEMIPRYLLTLLGKYIWMKPVIIPELCTNCHMCVESCPLKTIKAVKDGKPVIIPKGCISCLCCHELCPSKAIEMKSSWL